MIADDGSRLTPRYHAVIFTSQRIGADVAYGEMAMRMEALARAHPGCLGLDTARGPDGFGVTVSYWRDTDAIRDWKADTEHLAAQRRGLRDWYSAYSVQIALVERRYDGPQGRTLPSGVD